MWAPQQPASSSDDVSNGVASTGSPITSADADGGDSDSDSCGAGGLSATLVPADTAPPAAADCGARREARLMASRVMASVPSTTPSTASRKVQGDARCSGGGRVGRKSGDAGPRIDGSREAISGLLRS
eukprot:scaffold15468_cov111-Isochrysis_galbana.AAC.2